MLAPDYRHRNRFTRWVIAAIVLALILWASHVEYAAEAGAQPPARCEEDMDCWDCETMGNRICGPTQAPPVPVPADPEYTG